MTFPIGWGRRCPLTIQASRVDSDLTDFPVLLTKDTLPFEMFDADGSYPALNGGGDIRFSFDKNGSIQLACEIVTFITDNDPNNGKAEIWVKVPCLSSSMNTIIYIWYNAIDEIQPFSSDTYGSENVWDSNFKMVQHMNEDPSSSAPQMIDSTSNSNDGTSGGSMTSGDLVTTQIGDGLDFDGNDDFINCNFTTNYISAFTLEAWIKKDVDVPDSEIYEIISKRSYYATDHADFPFMFIINSSQKIVFGLSKGDNYTLNLTLNSSSTIDNSSFYHVVVVYKSTDYGKLYINNVEEASGAIDFTVSTDSRSWFIGRASYPRSGGVDKNEFTGEEDEVRISDIVRSPDWISACYNNQNDPSTFVIVGIPSTLVIVGINPEYTYVKSTHEFENFDVQVDFTICSGIDTTMCGVEIAFEINNNNKFYIRAGNFSGNQAFVCDFIDSGVDNFYTALRTNNYGKLRISRYVGNVTVYYKDGLDDNWIIRKSYYPFKAGKGDVLLGFYSSSSFRSSATLDNFIVNFEEGYSTYYFYDNFYSDDGDLYNTSLWTGSTSNIEIKNNKLHMIYGNTYTYVDTRYTPVGDFNVQVDFSIGTYQSYSTWAIYLHVFFKNSDRFGIRYQYASNNHLNYHTTSYVNSVWTTHATYGSDITSGKFRITRKGNTFSSYFLIGDKWFHFYDWHLEEETEIDYIRLARSSWSSVPSVECYFNNFKVNDDFDFYNDVRIDGNYSHVDGNYIKLVGGNVHTNKVIRSVNAVTFEWSITITNQTSYYSCDFVVCNTPFRNSYGDHSGESIHIMYYTNVFKLYIDGYAYSYIYDGDHRLFYPVYGQPYIIGIKFIPGTGTVIYWQGPTNGYLVLDYIINGDLYAWCGNMYGKGTYSDQVTTVHKFRCFEDKYLYKELKNDWLFSVEVNDNFNISDGRRPDSEKWVINGDPRVYNNYLKLMSTNEDKIQSRTFFCAPFEIVLDYNDLSFGFIAGLALSLNIEAYDSYKDTIFGVSKFKVGYSGGVASWVNYYCSGSSGNSLIYHISDVSNRKLKIVNDGRKVQYLLSDGNSWIIVLSQDCDKQYYYKVSIEGTNPGVIAYLDSITIDSEEFMTPTDAVALVPTAWKFSPTNKAYQNITYINLNELINGYKYFSIDTVAKIDDSLFLFYIEMDKELVNFDGAKVVGDNYASLISAIDAASDGEVVYVLPGTYNIGGCIISKDVIIVGIGDYRDIIIIISGSSVNVYGSEVIFKNITMINQLSNGNIGFKTQGDDISYFTMDSCKYSCSSTDVQMFRGDGTRGYYVYLRHSYIYLKYHYTLAFVDNPYKTIILDIFDCRILYSGNNYLFKGNDNYQIRSEIYANTSKYEPKVINTIPVTMLFSPHRSTSIYLNTPKGLEKTIKSKENEFNYLSFGNTLGGVTFYGGDEDYYFSEYLMPRVDNSFRLFIQGYIDTIRVFDRYQTYYETLNNINAVDDLGINLKLAHNNIIVDYKCYEPLNIYNSGLYLGRNTPSIVDEFMWSKKNINSSDLLLYYTKYLSKLEYTNYNIDVCDAQYKFFIDLSSTVGIGSLVQTQAHNFSNVTYYSDDIDDPSLIKTLCSLYDARWYVLSDSINQNVSDLTPGVFSIFPVVSGCDNSRWSYTGEFGYIDKLPVSVLSASSSLNSVYNIKWKRNKEDIKDYMVSNFSDSLTISLKLFGGGICDKIIIASGYNIGTEYAGYIIKCSIVIDGITRFNIEDNINLTITAAFNSISFTTIEIIVYEVKQVSEFSFANEHLSGNVLFIKYIKVLSSLVDRKFDTTLCNAYELYEPLKLKGIDTSETESCLLDYCFDTSHVDRCVSLSALDLDDLPSNEITSMFVIADNLCDCNFVVEDYVVDIFSESLTRSLGSWFVYFGDVVLYEEFFYITGNSTAIGAKFFKDTIFEIGTYREDIGTDTVWSITDELVLNIYSSDNIDNFYLCVGDKLNGRYYKWDFSLISGWNNLKLNFYGDHVTKYMSNIVTNGLLFKDLAIFNVWFGGIYSHTSGFVVLDTIFVDKSSVKNVLSSKEDAFYIPVYYESECGSIQMDFITYWGNKGKILEDISVNKVLLSVFADELSFSLVNKTSGEFVLGVYSYEQSIKIIKSFGKAGNFNVNDKLRLKLNWYSKNGYFWSELYINGFLIGKIQFNFIEMTKLKVTGIMVGGGSVYITSIYDSLSLCGKICYIKVYSDTVESKLTNDILIIDGKNLVENAPMYIGEIQPSEFVKLPVKYEGKSKQLSQLNLKLRWSGNY